jgi:hypothetical protein
MFANSFLFVEGQSWGHFWSASRGRTQKGLKQRDLGRPLHKGPLPWIDRQDSRVPTRLLGCTSGVMPTSAVSSLSESQGSKLQDLTDPERPWRLIWNSLMFLFKPGGPNTSRLQMEKVTHKQPKELTHGWSRASCAHRKALAQSWKM